MSLREWNSYGYKLMEHAAAFGYEAMNSGTFYWTLRNMEKDGLCESEWDTAAGEDRHVGCTPSRTPGRRV